MAISKQTECMRLDDDDEGSMDGIIKLATSYEDIQDLDSDEESFVDLYAVIEGRARSKPSISSLDDIKQQTHSKSARFSSRLEEDKRIHRTSTVLQSEHDHRQSDRTRRHVVRSHSPPPVAGSGRSSRQHQPSRDTPLEQRYRFHQENAKMKRAPLSSMDRVRSGSAESCDRNKASTGHRQLEDRKVPTQVVLTTQSDHSRGRRKSSPTSSTKPQELRPVSAAQFFHDRPAHLLSIPSIPRDLGPLIPNPETSFKTSDSKTATTTRRLLGRPAVRIEKLKGDEDPGPRPRCDIIVTTQGRNGLTMHQRHGATTACAADRNHIIGENQSALRQPRPNSSLNSVEPDPWDHTNDKFMCTDATAKSNSDTKTSSLEAKKETRKLSWQSIAALKPTTMSRRVSCENAIAWSATRKLSSSPSCEASAYGLRREDGQEMTDSSRKKYMDMLFS